MTVAGYVAEAGASGVSVDWKRLAGEASLTEKAAREVAIAIAARGQDGLGAVKRALPSHFEYGQVKVVAAMMARSEFWFSPDASADFAQQRQAADVAQPSLVWDPPQAKKARMSAEWQATENRPPPALTSDFTPDAPIRPALDAGAVLSWLERNGPASGKQLAQQFCRCAPHDSRRLSAVLRNLVEDMAVCRKGGNAAISSEVDLEDGATLYLKF